MEPVIDRIREIVAKHAGLSPDSIGDDQPFAGSTRADGSGEIIGLGFDSLDLIELAMRVGDAFDFDIPDDDVDDPELGTVCGLTAYVERRLGISVIPPQPIMH